MKKSRSIFITLIVSFLACGIIKSHIKGNIPNKKEFHNILKKD